ncbi:MAG: hypothetical protein UY82_C0039G0009 [Candidatus Uhrbacteria bacterium GW2011_GWC2_53_7]|uniref:Uncharacterized protein n=1 Tax=Candidatus Uhrbacteria bacterium GW2011_GWC2_53_7 TaxID=1618986 RepID=A0A0G2ARK9_9BACT|nr:MAG: hypothetical protein UY82_C0039G0009 [Candidatus Uhrbacteria bacterium GW2011_GWC2_53_7]
MASKNAVFRSKIRPHTPRTIFGAFAVPAVLTVHAVVEIFSAGVFGFEIKVLRPDRLRSQPMEKISVETLEGIAIAKIEPCMPLLPLAFRELLPVPEILRAAAIERQSRS